MNIKTALLGVVAIAATVVGALFHWDGLPEGLETANEAHEGYEIYKFWNTTSGTTNLQLFAIQLKADAEMWHDDPGLYNQEVVEKLGLGQVLGRPDNKLVNSWGEPINVTYDPNHGGLIATSGLPSYACINYTMNSTWSVAYVNGVQVNPTDRSQLGGACKEDGNVVVLAERA